MSPGTGDLAGVTQLLGLSWSWDGSWVSSSGSSLLVAATYLNRPGLTRPPAERFSGGAAVEGQARGRTNMACSALSSREATVWATWARNAIKPQFPSLSDGAPGAVSSR